MLPRASRRAAALLFVAAVLPLVPPGDAADPKPGIVPDTVYPKLAAQSTDVIRAALKGDVRPRAASKAATAAVMLAAFAQQNLGGDDGAQRAAVRDSALEIAAKIRKKDYADALKQLDALPALKADPKVKKEPVSLGPKASYKDLMTQFRHIKEGGLGVEDRFDTLGRSPGDEVPGKELTEALLLDAYRSAVTAELIRGYKPEGHVQDWQKFCDRMRRQSLDLAAAVAAKDGKATFKAVNGLNTTCDKCHHDFRKE